MSRRAIRTRTEELEGAVEVILVDIEHHWLFLGFDLLIDAQDDEQESCRSVSGNRS